ncbi:MAG: hypothetical protein Q8K75_03140 [Chlamydiales bacterium]|nr:hypothetical protein [Chlamydiales bacterium]
MNDLYRVGLSREAYRIPPEWQAHIPKTAKVKGFKVESCDPSMYSLPSPRKFNDWYLSDPNWAQGKVGDLVKLLRHQWMHYQHERNYDPLALAPSIMKLLVATDDLEDSKIISRDLPKLLSLVFISCIRQKLPYPVDFRDTLGTRLERFPGNYQTVFGEAMALVSFESFDTDGWHRRLCRIFDEKVLASDSEAKKLSDQTKAYAEHCTPSAGVMVGRCEVSFDTPEEFQQSETVGLARSIGKRSGQLDGAFYSRDIWAVTDGHGKSECFTYFLAHMEKRIRAALASRSETNPASTYNVVTKAILDFNDEMAEAVTDASGLVFVLGIKDGEYLHLFSLGDCTTVLCHPDKDTESLFPPQHIYLKNFENKEMIDKQLFHKAMQRGGMLVPFGKNLRVYHNGQVLEMVGVLGDKPVVGVVHRPLYRMLPLEELKDMTLLSYSDGVGGHMSPNDVNRVVKTSITPSCIAGECVKLAVQKAYARCIANASRSGRQPNLSQVDNATCMVIKL